MFETTFRNLDDTLRKDAGCSSELDYIEQTSWMLFLKYYEATLKKWITLIAYFILTALVFYHEPTSAQEAIVLHCTGVIKGETIRDSPKNFEIQVSTHPPNILGKVGDLSWCMSVKGKIKEPPCEITDQEITCRCSGGDVILPLSESLDILLV